MHIEEMSWALPNGGRLEAILPKPADASGRLPGITNVPFIRARISSMPSCRMRPLSGSTDGLNEHDGEPGCLCGQALSFAADGSVDFPEIHERFIEDGKDTKAFNISGN